MRLFHRGEELAPGAGNLQRGAVCRSARIIIRLLRISGYGQKRQLRISHPDLLIHSTHILGLRRDPPDQYSRSAPAQKAPGARRLLSSHSAGTTGPET